MASTMIIQQSPWCTTQTFAVYVRVSQGDKRCIFYLLVFMYIEKKPVSALYSYVLGAEGEAMEGKRREQQTRKWYYY